MSIYKSSSLAMIPSAYKDGKLYSVRPVEQLGSELVTNGDFSSASDWTFSGGGVAISGGKLNFTATTREATQSISVVNTKTYRVSYEVSNYSAGSVRAEIGSSVGVSRTANGIYSEYIVASGTNVIQIDAVSVFTGSIDNVSVKEVLVANGDFDFSRGSNLAATRVASSGYIEKGRENLLLQSNTFDTSWTLPSAAVTGGHSGYDGTNTAWELLSTAASCRVSQTISTSGVQTMSVYAKAGSVNWMALYVVATAPPYVYFDLANGVLGGVQNNVIEASMEDMGGGWYRCSIAFNKTATEARIFTATANGILTTTSGDSIYIQDAQLESGLVSTSVIETGASTAQAGILEDMPRLDYSGGATCPSLLLEPQRTNQIANSEYYGASGWTRTRMSITSNAGVSPDGTNNASYFVEDSSNDSHQMESNVVTGTGSITGSVFAKSGSRNEISLRLSGGVCSAYYDLDAGEVISASGGTATIEDYGNGWYRCILTDSSAAYGSGRMQIRSSLNESITYQGDGSNSLLIYGATFEEGSYPTSYIPTYGSSVTRSVDDVNEKTGVSNLIGQSEGTLFLEFETPDVSQFCILYQVRTTGSSNVGQIDFRIQSGNLRALGNDAGTTQFNISAGAAVTGTRYKCALRYANNDVAFYVNGVLKGSDTNASFSSSALQQVSFSENTGTFLPSASIHQAILFPTGLTNTELASLTTL